MKISSFARFLTVLTLPLVVACAGSTEKSTARSLNETAESTGSPYRWVYEESAEGGQLNTRLIGTPGRTAADEAVQADVMKMIVQAGDHGVADPASRPFEVRVVSMDESGSVEVWVFRGPVDDIVYVVDLKTLPSGDTDIDITGPW